METRLFVGAGETPLWLDLAVANRHGLIAGATGTGKTVSLRVLAEGFSAAGVPVFLADVKGDLGGLALPGRADPPIAERAGKVGMDWTPAGLPVVLWDVFGRQGHPLRTTVSAIGPIILARMLGLTEVQEGVLNLAFRLADDEGLLLLDLKDLQALLAHLQTNQREVAQRYGHVATSSVGAISRALLALENQGAGLFLGEPALDLSDLMLTAPDGRGAVSLLAADELMRNPRLYAMVLLWLLSELFETLPEVGDTAKPKLVFFFDEAHLLFADAPALLQDRIEQMVRLIRSKGVGVYFVTQSPLDIPDAVLGQLGHRIQHALRAFTPRDQKAVKAAAETFRPNPRLKTAEAIQELGKGEALLSFLDANGVPGMVQRALIAPPQSRLSLPTNEERARIVAESPVAGVYDQAIDRVSAYERLREQQRETVEEQPVRGWSRPGRAAPPRARGGTIGEAVVKSAARGLANSIGSSLGRQIVRGLLGAILK